VDATIIGAPSSTKNKDGKRDPQMHQTAKGTQWYFGMEAHIGVDSKTKVIHTILASAANVADSLALPHLLHGKETRVWGDQAHRGQKEAMPAVAPRAKDFTNQRYRWGDRVDERIKASNRTKARVRAKVEHVFGVIKRVFGFQKVRYRGLAKNLHGLEVTSLPQNACSHGQRRVLGWRCRCAIARCAMPSSRYFGLIARAIFRPLDRFPVAVLPPSAHPYASSGRGSKLFRYRSECGACV
jgi:hypothetical protein